MRLIESDEFPFEFLSILGERESWRKELHRPIYHVHKWWANRLGSVFRGILLGCALPEQTELEREFYRTHQFTGHSVLDPFMGSGSTIAADGRIRPGLRAASTKSSSSFTNSRTRVGRAAWQRSPTSSPTRSMRR